MPAGQACGLLGYCWNPSGVARPGWEGSEGGASQSPEQKPPLWMQMRRWESVHLGLGLLAPGLHKRQSARSKVGTSIAALTSPPPDFFTACIFIANFANFVSVHRRQSIHQNDRESFSCDQFHRVLVFFTGFPTYPLGKFEPCVRVQTI